MASIRARRRAFTLAELLIVITIITILSTISLVAMYGVIDQAKEQRTQAQIARLHTIVMEKWESYRTRAVPLRISMSSVPKFPKQNPTPMQLVAEARLRALRELMRMELPERQTDLDAIPPSAPGDTAHATTEIALEYMYEDPSDSAKVVKGVWIAGRIAAPSSWHAYRRRAGYGRFNPAPGAGATWKSPASWSLANEYAECLYMIVANSMSGEDSALKFFQESEIGDVDGDGMREILDAWGRPIYFLRWAPGYTYTWGDNGRWGVANRDDDENGTVDDPVPDLPLLPEILERGPWLGSDDQLVSELQNPNGKSSPDPFDPLRADRRWRDSVSGNEPFALVPLIYSAGRDGLYGVWDLPSVICYAEYDNDPYRAHKDTATGNPIQVGTPVDLGSVDNITNHLIEAK